MLRTRLQYPAFVVTVLVAVSSVSLASEPLRVSLCDLVRTPQTYDHKVIEVDGQTGGDWFEYAPLYDSNCGSAIQLRAGRNGALDKVVEKVGEALRASSPERTYIVRTSLVGRFIGSGDNLGRYFLEVYAVRKVALTVGHLPGRNVPPPSMVPAGH